MKKLILTLALIMAVCALPAYAGSYNYASPEKVKEWISAGTPVSIVDIQVEEEFNAHHLTGSIATYSYPVKSDADKAKLDSAADKLKQTDSPVVVVCPREKGVPSAAMTTWEAGALQKTACSSLKRVWRAGLIKNLSKKTNSCPTENRKFSR